VFSGEYSELMLHFCWLAASWLIASTTDADVLAAVCAVC
jgi:hypothetical protein